MVHSRLGGSPPTGAQLAFLTALVVALAACSTPAASSGTTSEDLEENDSKVDGAALDKGSDSLADAAADVVIACVEGGHGGGHGCACTTDDECQLSGHCVARADGSQACAMPCVAGSCDAGFSCASLPTAGGAAPYCVARYGRLCDPCANSGDCAAVGLAGAACVDYGAAGAFCGIQCLGDADCGDGYRCATATRIDGGQTQQCVRSGEGTAFGECPCSARAVASKLETACHLPDGAACKGKRSCESGTLSACSAAPKGAEICDGIDNNCNGVTDEGTCDDGSPCTTDSCDSANATPANQACLHTPNAGACSDGNACTQGDTCKSGACAPGTAANCDDNNPCSDDTCDAQLGCVHTFAPGKACSDGNACTLDDACDGGVCIAGALKLCDDGNDCTADTCDSSTGDCKATPFDGAACSDGDACTIFDTCKGGSCLGAANACDDDNPCTSAACDKASGCTFAPVAGQCSDGNACTNGEACAGGACTGGVAVVCSNPSGCAVAACDPQSGQCVASPKPDGTLCTDGTVCTAGDVCVGGACKGSAVNCDDSNACTADSCDAAAGCKHANLNGSCDDGNACTTGDGCSAGKCAGLATVCTASGPCVTSACSAGSGKCVELPVAGTVSCDDGTACTTGDACAAGKCAGAALDCNDKNDCTIDSCDAVTGCKHVVTTGNCSDGDACTTGDVCNNGTCAGVAIDVATACDDKNACTTDTCTKALGCVNANNTNACEDGNSCTSGDACAGGTCVSGANQCPCGTTANCASHEDGNLCNGTLKCDGATGTCVIAPNSVVSCPSGGDTACEQNGCVPATGACVMAAIHENQACTDDNACTGSDTCKSGSCVGTALSCDDGNACTADACDMASGCTHTGLDTGTCDADGNLCTTPDSCKGGTCVAGAAVVCNDNNPCTLDTCAPATGACSSVPVSDGLACDDGSACTTNDACTAGVCKGTVPPASVSLVAGSGTPGFTDAKGDLAQFTAPRALAVDAAGIVYVADTEDFRIRKIAVDGTVTKLAGLGTKGYLDGTASVARFWNPSGIAAKADGSILYVADRFNQRIRIVSGADGSVGTLAGFAPTPGFSDTEAQGGFQDGTGTNALFFEPVGIAIGPDGNLYVADSGNHRIRKVTPAGVVTTVAGLSLPGSVDGSSTVAQFNTPLGVAVASDGAVYVADAGDSRIRKITFDGLGAATVSTVSGTGAPGLVNGPAATAQFRSPVGIAVDSLGHVYVADSQNNVLREIFGGQVTTLAGTGTSGYTEGSLTVAQFNQVSGIAVAGVGTWFVADSLNHRIRKISDPARACK